MRTRNYLARVSWMFAPLFALSLFALSGGSDQTTPTILRGEVTDTICAKSGSHEEMMAKIPSMGRDKATCTKQCAAMGFKYVLYDEASKKLYNLDDQARAGTFAGRRVQIAGTVEGNNIKVRDFETIA